VSAGAPPAYITKPIKTLPELATPLTISSPAEAWRWGTWSELTPGLPKDIIIVGLMAHPDGLAVTRHYQVQIGKGSPAEPVITWGGAYYYTTLAGYDELAKIFPLVVPVRVPANTPIYARATDGSTSSLAYHIAIQYIELPLE